MIARVLFAVCLLSWAASAWAQLPGTSGDPYDVVEVCGDPRPDANCDQYNYIDFEAEYWVTGAAWVPATQPGAGVSCASLGASAYGGGSPSWTFAPLDALPAGSCVALYSEMLDAVEWVPPSTLTVGGAGPYTPPFDVTQLDAPSMSYAFAAGFVIVGIGFAVGKAVSMLLKTI